MARVAARLLQRSPVILLLTLAPAACVGCASTLNPAPFRQFSAAVQEARTGMDAALALGTEWTREERIESFAADSGSAFSDLILALDAGYAWSLPDTSTYLALQATRSTLTAFNGALAEYAVLLADLATAELTSESTYELLSHDLNQSAAGIARATRGDFDPGNAALISTGTGELFRRYIGARQEDVLRQALVENQESIGRIADHCIALVRIIRESIKGAYTERYEPIRIRWTEARVGKRVKPTEEMLDLNDACIQALRVLEELELAYRELPAAHASLAASLEDPAADVQAIHRLFESARRLHRLYVELRSQGAALQTQD